MENVTPAKSPTERFLGLFADVRAGEGATALLLTLNVLLLLTAYYVVKPVREALILSFERGAEYKTYMSAVIAFALLLVVPVYARLSDRLPKIRLVAGATLFFASHLVLFWISSGHERVRAVLGLLFYVWVGIFNMMVVAQFWAYANDVYDPERGKRLFPLVALGASLGAALGAKVAALLIPGLGVFAMLLVAAGLLVACAGLFLLAERGRPAKVAAAAVPAPAPGQSEARGKAPASGAFGLVLKHRYLALLAAFALVFSCVNTNGEYLLARLVKADAAAAVARGALAADQVGKHIGAFYGDFFFYVNVLGVVLQSFVVSRVVKHLGLGVAFLVLPAIVLGNSLLILGLPMLSALRLGKVGENAVDYSLNNTVRQMLWLPTTEEMKYKAKQAVDTFFVRMGDVSSALLVYAGSALLAWNVRGFALTNLVLVLVWLVIAAAILREHRRLSHAS